MIAANNVTLRIGKKALFENKDKIKHEQNIAYLNAMRDFQEDFFKVEY